MTRRGDIKAGTFQRIARTMSRNWSITVRFRGMACSTDGVSTIDLPHNADSLKTAVKKVVHGELDHELGHVNAERKHREWNDLIKAGRVADLPRPVQDAYREHGRIALPSTLMTETRKKGGPTAMLMNAFEDVRIERVESDGFVGVAENLGALHGHCRELLSSEYGGETGAAKLSSPGIIWHGLGCGIIALARGEEMPEWMPAPLRTILGMLTDEIEAAGHTRVTEDTLKLAERVVEKLTDIKDEEPPPPPTPEEPEQDDGDTDEDADTGDQDKLGDNEDGTNEDAADGDGDQDQGDPETGDGDPETDDGEQDGESGENESEGDDGTGSDGAGEESGDEADGEGTADGDPETGDDDQPEGGDPGDSDEMRDGDTDKPTDPGNPGSGSGGDGDEATDEDADSESSGDGEGDGDEEDEDDIKGIGDTLGDESSKAENEGGDEVKDTLEMAFDENAPGGPGSDLNEVVKKWIESEATKAAVESKDTLIPYPEVAALDRWVTAESNDIEVYNALKRKVSKAISGMRSKLSNVLRTQTQASTARRRRRGRLDTKLLASASTGSRNVFSVTSEGEAIDTAIEILIDESGSMSDGDEEGTGAYAARMTTIALAETFSTLDIPFEVIGFQNRWEGPRSSMTSHRKHWEGTVKGPYQRYLPYLFTIYKSFNETHKKTRTRLASITGGHENVDGGAVTEAARRLAQRPESRRILIVISDGEPAGGARTDLAKAELNRVIKDVTRAGIEVIGIGAASTAVRNYYHAANGADHIVVNDLDRLAVDVFKVVRARLLAKRGRRAG